MGKQSRVGKMNKDQSSSQYYANGGQNDIEFSEEIQVGNTKGQSQKKSGRQLNKKKGS